MAGNSKDLIKLCQYVEGLTEGSDADIFIGRSNNFVDGEDMNVIAVDSISTATLVSRIDNWEKSTETQTIGARYRRDCQVIFYGSKAYDNLEFFEAMMGSQKAVDLQRSIEISVHPIKSKTDVRLLTGSQYNNCIECTLTIVYNSTIDISTPALVAGEINYLFES